MRNIKQGEIYLTEGGWKAMVCIDEMAVYHAIDGGQLYSHDLNGIVRSSTVGHDYNLQYLLTPINEKR